MMRHPMSQKRIVAEAQSRAANQPTGVEYIMNNLNKNNANIDMENLTISQIIASIPLTDDTPFPFVIAGSSAYLALEQLSV